MYTFGMNNYIPLTNCSDRVLVDSDIYDLLGKYKWHKSADGYAIGSVSSRNGMKWGERHKFVRMHRVIMKADKGQLVDHINRNKLDNRRSNLRFATKSINTLNAKVRVNSKSGVTGVNFHSGRNRWRAYMTLGYVHIGLGWFRTKEEAVEARKEAESKIGFKEKKS